MDRTRSTPISRTIRTLNDARLHTTEVPKNSHPTFQQLLAIRHGLLLGLFSNPEEPWIVGRAKLFVGGS